MPNLNSQTDYLKGISAKEAFQPNASLEDQKKALIEDIEETLSTMMGELDRKEGVEETLYNELQQIKAAILKEANIGLFEVGNKFVTLLQEQSRKLPETLQKTAARIIGFLSCPEHKAIVEQAYESQERKEMSADEIRNETKAVLANLVSQTEYANGKTFDKTTEIFEFISGISRDHKATAPLTEELYGQFEEQILNKEYEKAGEIYEKLIVSFQTEKRLDQLWNTSYENTTPIAKRSKITFDNFKKLINESLESSTLNGKDKKDLTADLTRKWQKLILVHNYEIYFIENSDKLQIPYYELSEQEKAAFKKEGTRANLNESIVNLMLNDAIKQAYFGALASKFPSVPTTGTLTEHFPTKTLETDDRYQEFLRELYLYLAKNKPELKFHGSSASYPFEILFPNGEKPYPQIAEAFDLPNPPAHILILRWTNEIQQAQNKKETFAKIEQDINYKKLSQFEQTELESEVNRKNLEESAELPKNENLRKIAEKLKNQSKKLAYCEISSEAENKLNEALKNRGDFDSNGNLNVVIAVPYYTYPKATGQKLEYYATISISKSGNDYYVAVHTALDKLNTLNGKKSIVVPIKNKNLWQALKQKRETRRIAEIHEEKERTVEVTLNTEDDYKKLITEIKSKDKRLKHTWNLKTEYGNFRLVSSYTLGKGRAPERAILSLHKEGEAHFVAVVDYPDLDENFLQAQLQKCISDIEKCKDETFTPLADNEAITKRNLTDSDASNPQDQVASQPESNGNLLKAPQNNQNVQENLARPVPTESQPTSPSENQQKALTFFNNILNETNLENGRNNIRKLSLTINGKTLNVSVNSQGKWSASIGTFVVANNVPKDDLLQAIVSKAPLFGNLYTSIEPKLDKKPKERTNAPKTQPAKKEETLLEALQRNESVQKTLGKEVPPVPKAPKAKKEEKETVLEKSSKDPKQFMKNINLTDFPKNTKKDLNFTLNNTKYTLRVERGAGDAFDIKLFTKGEQKPKIICSWEKDFNIVQQKLKNHSIVGKLFNATVTESKTEPAPKIESQPQPAPQSTSPTQTPEPAKSEPTKKSPEASDTETQLTEALEQLDNDLNFIRQVAGLKNKQAIGPHKFINKNGQPNWIILRQWETGKYTFRIYDKEPQYNGKGALPHNQRSVIQSQTPVVEFRINQNLHYISQFKLNKKEYCQPLAKKLIADEKISFIILLEKSATEKYKISFDHETKTFELFDTNDASIAKTTNKTQVQKLLEDHIFSQPLTQEEIKTRQETEQKKRSETEEKQRQKETEKALEKQGKDAIAFFDAIATETFDKTTGWRNVKPDLKTIDGHTLKVSLSPENKWFATIDGKQIAKGVSKDFLFTSIEGTSIFGEIYKTAKPKLEELKQERENALEAKEQEEARSKADHEKLETEQQVATYNFNEKPIEAALELHENFPTLAGKLTSPNHKITINYSANGKPQTAFIRKEANGKFIIEIPKQQPKITDQPVEEILSTPGVLKLDVENPEDWGAKVESQLAKLHNIAKYQITLAVKENDKITWFKIQKEENEIKLFKENRQIAKVTREIEAKNVFLHQLYPKHPETIEFNETLSLHNLDKFFIEFNKIKDGHPLRSQILTFKMFDKNGQATDVTLTRYKKGIPANQAFKSSFMDKATGAPLQELFNSPEKARLQTSINSESDITFFIQKLDEFNEFPNLQYQIFLSSPQGNFWLKKARKTEPKFFLKKTGENKGLDIRTTALQTRLKENVLQETTEQITTINISAGLENAETNINPLNDALNPNQQLNRIVRISDETQNIEFRMAKDTEGNLIQTEFIIAFNNDEKNITSQKEALATIFNHEFKLLRHGFDKCDKRADKTFKINNFIDSLAKLEKNDLVKIADSFTIYLQGTAGENYKITKQGQKYELFQNNQSKGIANNLKTLSELLTKEFYPDTPSEKATKIKIPENIDLTSNPFAGNLTSKFKDLQKLAANGQAAEQIFTADNLQNLETLKLASQAVDTLYNKIKDIPINDPTKNAQLQKIQTFEQFLAENQTLINAIKSAKLDDPTAKLEEMWNTREFESLLTDEFVQETLVERDTAYDFQENLKRRISNKQFESNFIPDFSENSKTFLNSQTAYEIIARRYRDKIKTRNGIKIHPQVRLFDENGFIKPFENTENLFKNKDLESATINKLKRYFTILRTEEKLTWRRFCMTPIVDALTASTTSTSEPAKVIDQQLDMDAEGNQKLREAYTKEALTYLKTLEPKNHEELDRLLQSSIDIASLDKNENLDKILENFYNETLRPIIIKSFENGLFPLTALEDKISEPEINRLYGEYCDAYAMKFVEKGAITEELLTEKLVTANNIENAELKEIATLRITEIFERQLIKISGVIDAVGKLSEISDLTEKIRILLTNVRDETGREVSVVLLLESTDGKPTIRKLYQDNKKALSSSPIPFDNTKSAEILESLEIFGKDKLLAKQILARESIEETITEKLIETVVKNSRFVLTKKLWEQYNQNPNDKSAKDGDKLSNAKAAYLLETIANSYFFDENGDVRDNLNPFAIESLEETLLKGFQGEFTGITDLETSYYQCFAMIGKEANDAINEKLAIAKAYYLFTQPENEEWKENEGYKNATERLKTMPVKTYATAKYVLDNAYEIISPKAYLSLAEVENYERNYYLNHVLPKHDLSADLIQEKPLFISNPNEILGNRTYSDQITAYFQGTATPNITDFALSIGLEEDGKKQQIDLGLSQTFELTFIEIYCQIQDLDFTSPQKFIDFLKGNFAQITDNNLPNLLATTKEELGNIAYQYVENLLSKAQELPKWEEIRNQSNYDLFSTNYQNKIALSFIKKWQALEQAKEGYKITLEYGKTQTQDNIAEAQLNALRQQIDADPVFPSIGDYAVDIKKLEVKQTLSGNAVTLAIEDISKLENSLEEVTEGDRTKDIIYNFIQSKVESSTSVPSTSPWQGILQLEGRPPILIHVKYENNKISLSFRKLDEETQQVEFELKDELLKETPPKENDFKKSYNEKFEEALEKLREKDEIEEVINNTEKVPQPINPAKPEESGLSEDDVEIATKKIEVTSSPLELWAIAHEETLIGQLIKYEGERKEEDPSFFNVEFEPQVWSGIQGAIYDFEKSISEDENLGNALFENNRKEIKTIKQIEDLDRKVAKIKRDAQGAIIETTDIDILDLQIRSNGKTVRKILQAKLNDAWIRYDAYQLGEREYEKNKNKFNLEGANYQAKSSNDYFIISSDPKNHIKIQPNPDSLAILQDQTPPLQEILGTKAEELIINGLSQSAQNGYKYLRTQAEREGKNPNQAVGEFLITLAQNKEAIYNERPLKSGERINFDADIYIALEEIKESLQISFEEQDKKRIQGEDATVEAQSALNELAQNREQENLAREQRQTTQMEIQEMVQNIYGEQVAIGKATRLIEDEQTQLSDLDNQILGKQKELLNLRKSETDQSEGIELIERDIQNLQNQKADILRNKVADYQDRIDRSNEILETNPTLNFLKGSYDPNDQTTSYETKIHVINNTYGEIQVPSEMFDSWGRVGKLAQEEFAKQLPFANYGKDMKEITEKLMGSIRNLPNIIRKNNRNTIEFDDLITLALPALGGLGFFEGFRGKKEFNERMEALEELKKLNANPDKKNADRVKKLLKITGVKYKNLTDEQKKAVSDGKGYFEIHQKMEAQINAFLEQTYMLLGVFKRIFEHKAEFMTEQAEDLMKVADGNTKNPEFTIYGYNREYSRLLRRSLETRIFKKRAYEKSIEPTRFDAAITIIREEIAKKYKDLSTQIERNTAIELEFLRIMQDPIQAKKKIEKALKNPRIDTILETMNKDLEADKARYYEQLNQAENKLLEVTTNPNEKTTIIKTFQNLRKKWTYEYYLNYIKQGEVVKEKERLESQKLDGIHEVIPNFSGPYSYSDIVSNIETKSDANLDATDSIAISDQAVTQFCQTLKEDGIDAKTIFYYQTHKDAILRIISEIGNPIEEDHHPWLDYGNQMWGRSNIAMNEELRDAVKNFNILQTINFEESSYLVLKNIPEDILYAISSHVNKTKLFKKDKGRELSILLSDERYSHTENQDTARISDILGANEQSQASYETEGQKLRAKSTDDFRADGEALTDFLNNYENGPIAGFNDAMREAFIAMVTDRQRIIGEEKAPYYEKIEKKKKEITDLEKQIANWQTEINDSETTAEKKAKLGEKIEEAKDKLPTLRSELIEIRTEATEAIAEIDKKYGNTDPKTKRETMYALADDFVALFIERGGVYREKAVKEIEGEIEEKEKAIEENQTEIEKRKADIESAKEIIRQALFSDNRIEDPIMEAPDTLDPLQNYVKLSPEDQRKIQFFKDEIIRYRGEISSKSKELSDKNKTISAQTQIIEERQLTLDQALFNKRGTKILRITELRKENPEENKKEIKQLENEIEAINQQFNQIIESDPVGKEAKKEINKAISQKKLLEQEITELYLGEGIKVEKEDSRNALQATPLNRTPCIKTAGMEMNRILGIEIFDPKLDESNIIFNDDDIFDPKLDESNIIFNDDDIDDKTPVIPERNTDLAIREIIRLSDYEKLPKEQKTAVYEALQKLKDAESKIKTFKNENAQYTQDIANADQELTDIEDKKANPQNNSRLKRLYEKEFESKMAMFRDVEDVNKFFDGLYNPDGSPSRELFELYSNLSREEFETMTRIARKGVDTLRTEEATKHKIDIIIESFDEYEEVKESLIKMYEMANSQGVTLSAEQIWEHGQTLKGYYDRIRNENQKTDEQRIQSAFANNNPELADAIAEIMPIINNAFIDLKIAAFDIFKLDLAKSAANPNDQEQTNKFVEAIAKVEKALKKPIIKALLNAYLEKELNNDDLNHLAIDWYKYCELMVIDKDPDKPLAKKYLQDKPNLQGLRLLLEGNNVFNNTFTRLSQFPDGKPKDRFLGSFIRVIETAYQSSLTEEEYQRLSETEQDARDFSEGIIRPGIGKDALHALKEDSVILTAIRNKNLLEGLRKLTALYELPALTIDLGQAGKFEVKPTAPSLHEVKLTAEGELETRFGDLTGSAGIGMDIRHAIELAKDSELSGYEFAAALSPQVGLQYDKDFGNDVYVRGSINISFFKNGEVKPGVKARVQVDIKGRTIFAKANVGPLGIGASIGAEFLSLGEKAQRKFEKMEKGAQEYMAKRAKEIQEQAEQSILAQAKDTIKPQDAKILSEQIMRQSLELALQSDTAELQLAMQKKAWPIRFKGVELGWQNGVCYFKVILEHPNGVDSIRIYPKEAITRGILDQVTTKRANEREKTIISAFDWKKNPDLEALNQYSQETAKAKFAKLTNLPELRFSKG